MPYEKKGYNLKSLDNLRSLSNKTKEDKERLDRIRAKGLEKRRNRKRIREYFLKRLFVGEEYKNLFEEAINMAKKGKGNLDAIKTVFDYAGLKPTEKVESKVNLNSYTKFLDNLKD